ncbi:MULTISPECIES: efflux RND transporter periplasmic adaptor subunit [Roseivirga]|jgi:RND family efflux transporter MFP subunit|uniref:efflux RND transporter periplasmic adaptor subunit n=1 Tax=Roseivirga TaxID=290180 RepID=UPI00257F86F7|nr:MULTISPECIES: efflux RND transporter periplasmic adaptor subunit [Roseivirga]MEC7755926.1 efflux RND transporter periplasmic adaptor subunit [Bacteroidota bacterium]|tara:strand:+ start:2923 stop:4203 length:1281 start_codon:yes stop_codon:yes gene_type:complete
MKNRKVMVITGVFVALIIFFITKVNKGSSMESEVLTQVKVGLFRSEVTASGELYAKNSVNILGPDGMRQANIWETTISHIIDEGTVVAKGDYVARLDQSELGQKIQQASSDFTISSSQYKEAKLDTAMELRKAREEMDNMLFEMEKQKLVLENSQYEPPATIKEKTMELERAQKRYDQAKENYKLQLEKAKAKVAASEAEMLEDKRRLDFLQEISNQFVITAPEAGMLIYRRDWRGNKIAQGGRVASYDPIVATLPDLTSMISKTYINEVDINTVSAGQFVEIGLDAFPEKKLTGVVTSVANMGQQRPNSDSKVFEVVVEINESDTTLRPGMSTSNKIIAKVVEQAMFVPVEAIHSQGDSITYVLLKDGLSIVKQEVELGISNSDQVIIKSGLTEGQSVYLSDPSGINDFSLKRLNNSQSIAQNNK